MALECHTGSEKDAEVQMAMLQIPFQWVQGSAIYLDVSGIAYKTDEDTNH
jgi:hypothetical protein